MAGRVQRGKAADLAGRLPFSQEAECAVLGAVILDNRALGTALETILPRHFFLAPHQKIFGRMVDMGLSGRPIDLVTLTENLQQAGELEIAGGPGYLAQLIDGVPRIANVAQYAHIVREKAMLREIIHAAGAIQEQAFGGQDAASLAEGAVQQMLGLSTNGMGTPVVREWSDAATEASKGVHYAAYHTDEETRLNFGIEALDEKTSGLRKKELVLLVGMTSHGKSLLAQQLASTAEKAGYSGLIFSAEMSAAHWALREIAWEAGIPFWQVRRPERLAGQMDALMALHQAAGRERKLAIVDQGITPARIWALTEARKRARGLDFVIVDYDQLVVQAGLDPEEDDRRFFTAQGKFVWEAVQRAKALDICFLLLAQPRKVPPEVMQGKRGPQLTDIFGTSQMANTPHTVLWVVREYLLHDMDDKYENKARVYVLKARNDRTGVVHLEFDPQRLRFLDAKEQYEKAKKG